MKNFKGILSALAVAATLFQVNTAAVEAAEPIEIIKEGVKYSESVLAYRGGLYVSNYGMFNPDKHLDEKLGFINYYKNGEMKEIIKPGLLEKPTAMVVRDNILFVCDNKNVKYFDLDEPDEVLGTIEFEDGDTCANALDLDGKTLYITTTNPGAVYRVDVSNARAPKKPERWLEIAGANGISVLRGTGYVATIPLDFSTVEDKFMIYRINAVTGEVEPFRHEPGLYDGAALSEDGKTLYITEWSSGATIAIDVKTKTERIIYAEEGVGPADIAVRDGKVYIPDLMHSRIIICER